MSVIFMDLTTSHCATRAAWHPPTARVLALLVALPLTEVGCDVTIQPANNDGGMIDGGVHDGAVANRDGSISGPVKLHGAAEKGPFVLGSSVSVIAVTSSGDPTGVVFKTETVSDLGFFDVGVTSSGPVALEAAGFYYNEVMGALSRAPLTLRGWYDVGEAETQSANINVFTHLCNRRVRALLQQGATLDDAVQLAESELVGALSIAHPTSVGTGTSLTLTDSAYLFAVSAVLAEAGRTIGGEAGADSSLQELLNQLAVDLETDGALSTQNVATILAAERSLDVAAAMANLAARMMALGQSGAPPNLNTVIDSDTDGFVNSADNCPNVANNDQTDSNDDAVGDACCGDGQVEGSEECDAAGANADTADCTSHCMAARCGDGLTHSASEACDDGNDVNGDDCDNNCTITDCGNGVVSDNEACDDGNYVNGDGCDNNCTPSACGNGQKVGSEACDDGNDVQGDGCDNNCTVSACGNGVPAGSEVCDDGNAVNGDGCDNNCTVSACGNGQKGGSEACDDGNGVQGDGCDNNCTVSACGNGQKVGSEICDDGNKVNGDGCDNNCTTSACGNGQIGGAEQCDDGNLADFDGCTHNCLSSAILRELVPSGVVAGGSDLALKLSGAQFTANSQAFFGTTALDTDFVSASEVHATIPAVLLASAGFSDVTIHQTDTATVSQTLRFSVANSASPRGAWSATGSMVWPLSGATISLLPNGKAVIVDGEVGGHLGPSTVNSYELYDPATGQFTKANDLVRRESHAAAVLANGKLLVAGGMTSWSIYTATASLYDPATDTWTATGSLNSATSAISMLPLGAGAIAVHESTEIYDASSGTWTVTAAAPNVGTAHGTLSKLSDDKILAVGSAGTGVNTALYDPLSSQWTDTGSLLTPRSRHQAVVLSDGRVLVMGGINGESSTVVASAELYDPASGTWSYAGNMLAARVGHAAVLLPSGRVLVIGGSSIFQGNAPLATTEIFDPDTGLWSPGATMAKPRDGAYVVVLQSGLVLAAGGWANDPPNPEGLAFPTQTAELFDPSVP
jgi:cysteine-rich repeat protein